ncbi:MAG TPA: ribose 5-phosphate isomerase B [bacterium (Candidatus Stahlbacteria)]|nr:ribose 5-phosphate isomerase B [Candidatus Stahlbacteria bacterium]
MKIAIGSDHRGYQLKEEIKEFLKGNGFEPIDLGPESDASCDYPDFAIPVGEMVRDGRARFGILICHTGIGMTFTAAKVKGVRPALCRSPDDAHMARAHNDANVLVLAARDQDLKSFKEVWQVWSDTDFEGGRHQRRVDKIKDYEDRTLSC